MVTVLRKTNQKLKSGLKDQRKKGFYRCRIYDGTLLSERLGSEADGIRALSWYKRAAKKGKIDSIYDGLHASYLVRQVRRKRLKDMRGQSFPFKWI